MEDEKTPELTPDQIAILAEMKKAMVQVAQVAATAAAASALEQFADGIENSTVSVAASDPGGLAHVMTARNVAKSFAEAAREQAAKLRAQGVPIGDFMKDA